MFYRVSIQIKTVPPSWQWKSTPLSSFDAVVRFLRLHRAIPQDRLRVFSSATRAGLQEQFKLEQGAMGIHSVTAAHFLRERKISSGETNRETSEQKANENREAVCSRVANLLAGYRGSMGSPTLDSICFLDSRRLEIELGSGGDHDLPYHFALPHVWPQAHAWTKLFARIQGGDLQP